MEINTIIIIFSFFLTTIISSTSPHTVPTTSIPTSCKGLADGYHYIKILEDDEENDISYPILYVQCDRDYVIIDHALDSDWTSYFSSWIKYHYAVVGPIRNDHSNWIKWFLPERFQVDANDYEDIKLVGQYLVSPGCSECSEESPLQISGLQSSYYMSALAFGCFNQVRGWPACDMDFETYECKTCKWDQDLTQIAGESRNPGLAYEDAVELGVKTGVCDFEIRNAQQSVVQSFSKCAAMGIENDNINWKPSLGIDGRFCQCWTPYHEEQVSITVATNLLNQKKKQMSSKEEEAIIQNEITDHEDVVSIIKLSQEDFTDGTYRITLPGTYILVEDIVFDFNPSPDGHLSPNNVYDNYYWPLSRDNKPDKYPGAMDARDAYFLGFFAGVTIECQDVILDLNGFELRMSRKFYYQQPYFSIIELANQPFLPGQGPGFFGSDPLFAKGVTIKNGVLGLSSHHGIHGNFNIDVKLHDLQVRNFQTHGIQLNGFNDLLIKDCDIGPSTTIAHLNGNYAQMRLLLPKLNIISNAHQGETITFANRDEAVSMRSLTTKLVHEMDMVFNYVIDGTTYENDPYWAEAFDKFINPTGLSMGAVLYGLFLNYPSAGIFGWHVNDQESFNVLVENVEIHDLRHAGLEIVGFSEGGRVLCNTFNGPLPAEDLFGEHLQSFGAKLYTDDFDNVEYAQYIGSIITDIHIAMYYWGIDDYDNWAGIPFMGNGDQIVKWAIGEHPKFVSSTKANKFSFYCNEDAMFHPAKGLLGLKISGVEDANLKNVKIYNLQDETKLGSYLCGEVENPHHGMYHFAQQLPYQVGFSMNMVMGLTIDFSHAVFEDVYINGLSSDTGLTYGMAAWFETTIAVHGDFQVSNLNAGVNINYELKYSDLPNKAPEACAVRLYDVKDYQLDIDWDDDLSINQYCIKGAVGCLGDVYKYTHLETIDADYDSNNCDPLPFQHVDKEENENELMNGNSIPITNTTPILNDNMTFIIVVISILIILACSIKLTLNSIKKQNKNRLNEYTVSEHKTLIQRNAYGTF